MQIKEYKIPLPLSCDEYRIAQLYMLAKKSRQESHGEGSGVEILVNEPYEDGPGPDGRGQYTHKVYHVGSHLPGWLKSLIPKSALSVEEVAWNNYPYTKTKFTCPFVEKFSIEVETFYFNDGGHQENVFNLSKKEMKEREVDVIDVVKDQLYGADYLEEEDPCKFISEKTGRGPLGEEWIKEYWAECEGKKTPLANGKAIMSAYKLCKVEFKYWGMQTKIENFIHDIALRKTMLRAHRQAWAWLDEWWGLTIEDIRAIEAETKAQLTKQYGVEEEEAEAAETSESGDMSGAGIDVESSSPSREEPSVSDERTSGVDVNSELPRVVCDEADIVFTSNNNNSIDGASESSRLSASSGSPKLRRKELNVSMDSVSDDAKRKSWSRSGSRNTLNSQQASWRMESIRRDSDTSDSEEEFYDCQGTAIPIIKEDLEESNALNRWSSMELLPHDDDQGLITNSQVDNQGDSIFSHQFMSRVALERQSRVIGRSMEASAPPSPSLSPSHQLPGPCPSTVLIMVIHAGSVLDPTSDLNTKKSDLTTFKGALETVMRQHYPHMVGRVAMRLVAAPPICSDSLNVLSSLNPYGLDSSVCADVTGGDSVPVSAVPILAASSPEYEDSVSRVVAAANVQFHEFLRSEEGHGFQGQVCIIGDSIGGVMAYDALCRGSGGDPSRVGANNNIPEGETPSLGDSVDGYSRSTSMPPSSHQESVSYNRSQSDSDCHYGRHLHAQHLRRRSSSSSEHGSLRLEFEVCDLFTLGCPLALVLVYRKMLGHEDKNCVIQKPGCHQVYNLFHPTDPLAIRLEPLISARFSLLPPVVIPRYTKYPLGDGYPTHLLECIQAHGDVFADLGSNGSPALGTLGQNRRLSDASILSTVSGMGDTVPIATINALSSRWWGAKRLDYALYCPEGLANFPTNSLPYLFHASFWESQDVAGFVLRQIVRTDQGGLLVEDKDLPVFSPTQPREKWIKKRTSVKIKNIAANHRGNDLIVREGASQTLQGRFMYGPLDMVTLSGEKVDIHIMRDPPGGDWQQISTDVVDKTGRIFFTIPPDKQLGYGMYPVKMVVRGDHTSCNLYLTVVPNKTECVVFSIDGSFTASVSVTGKDPKVRAGAVDVVRHWQELGYLIIYVTGRPDMQQQKVVAWLAQHNFPHGLVSFADGLSTDPLGHKTSYLRTLIQDHGVLIQGAYGSAKDIQVYTGLGLKSEQMYIVGKVAKKQHSNAMVLSDGYAAHLSQLSALGKSRPARNPQMVIPRGFFGLPGQNNALRRRRSAKRTTSYPVLGSSANEGVLRKRGSSASRPNHMSMRC